MSEKTLTSAGFYVSAEAFVPTANPVPTPTAPPPEILRCAYMEIVVSDLAVSRAFYVDVLNLVVTAEDEHTIYLRTTEEFIHHNVVLRQGPDPAVAAFAYRVQSPAELDKAVAFYTELGCRVERRKEGFVRGVGDSVRVQDPLGFPCEFFYDIEHVERLAWRYDLHSAGALVRLDHFNQVTPDVPRATRFMQDLGFRVTEDIQDEHQTVYAAWMRRKSTVHDTAMTGGEGPRMHHIAFATHEKHNILHICDKLGALRLSDRIERGPGRHGFRTRSISTCVTRTGTASRSIPRTITPATPTTRSSPGTYTTTSAATGGAMPSYRPGTRKHRESSTSTATCSRSSHAPTAPKWRSPSARTASLIHARTTRTTTASTSSAISSSA